MTKHILILLSLLLPLASSAGTVTKVPATEAGDPAVVYDYLEYHVVGAQQSDHDGTELNCLPVTRYTSTSAGVLGVAYTTYMADTFDCSTGAALKTHAADTGGTSSWFDHWKPPGIKWTVTRFDCAMVEPTPGSGSLATEDLHFNIGYRTEDTATTVSEELVTLDSTADAGVWVSNTAIEEVIGETNEATSLVMMFTVDDDTGDAGDNSYLNINVKCIVTVKVE